MLREALSNKYPDNKVPSKKAAHRLAAKFRDKVRYLQQQASPASDSVVR